MVFVHSRKNTARLAEFLVEKALKRGEAGLFIKDGGEALKPGSPLYRQEVSKCKSAQLKALLPRGIGIHHAGLLRPDRRAAEKLFEMGKSCLSFDLILHYFKRKLIFKCKTLL